MLLQFASSGAVVCSGCFVTASGEERGRGGTVRDPSQEVGIPGEVWIKHILFFGMGISPQSMHCIRWYRKKLPDFHA